MQDIVVWDSSVFSSPKDDWLHYEFISSTFITISTRDSKIFPAEQTPWIFELIMNSRIHECRNFMELYFSQQYNSQNVLLFRWMKFSANENYFKYYSFPFPRFHRFSFHNLLWVWLISQQIRNFGGFFEIKVDIQMKTRAIITFTSTMETTFTPSYFPLKVILSRSTCFCFQILL